MQSIQEEDFLELLPRILRNCLTRETLMASDGIVMCWRPFKQEKTMVVM